MKVNELPVESIVHGRYRIMRLVGRGGFGITYRARDMKLERDVAIKECFPARCCVRRDDGYVSVFDQDDADYYNKALEMAEKEARTIANIKHDNVVHVYDVFRERGSVYIAMPFLEGGTLRERITSGNIQNSEQWLQQILSALSHLHSAGIVHHDIKPENIMFDAEKPVLIDFGAAKNFQQIQHSNTSTVIVRSVGYAAPEQGTKIVGAWTDLFCLAATWYELLTGECPPGADERLIDDDENFKPLSERSLRVEYPASVVAMLDQCLAIKPKDRYQSAGECLHAMGVAGAKPRVKKISGTKKNRKWQWWAAGIVLVAWFIHIADDESQPSGGPQPLPSDQPITQPVVDMAKIKSDLKAKVRQACRVDDFIAQVEADVAEKRRLIDEGERVLGDLIQRYRLEAEKVTSSSELSPLGSQMRREYNKLHKAQWDIIQGFVKKAMKKEASFPAFEVSKMTQVYTPADLNEAAMLQTVCEEIYSDEINPRQGLVVVEGDPILDKMDREKEKFEYGLNAMYMKLTNEEDRRKEEAQRRKEEEERRRWEEKERQREEEERRRQEEERRRNSQEDE